MTETRLSFHWADYMVFALSLLLPLVIGIYFAVKSWKKPSTDTFLLGGRNINFLAVSLSIVASLMNGVFIIGIPAELFFFGPVYSLLVCGLLIFAGPIITFILIPTFRKMELISAYEYFDRRHNFPPLRIAVSLTFIVSVLLFLAVVLYVPAFSFSKVIGLSMTASILSTGIVCIIYTALGGLKAVVWTDALQMAITMAGLVTLTTLGIYNDSLGGIGEVFDRVREGNRLDFGIWDPDPRARHTVWTMLIGHGLIWMSAFGTNQMSVQRFLAVSSVRKAQYFLFFDSSTPPWMIHDVYISNIHDSPNCTSPKLHRCHLDLKTVPVQNYICVIWPPNCTSHIGVFLMGSKLVEVPVVLYHSWNCSAMLLVVFTVIVFMAVVLLMSWVMYAYYFNCNPMKAGTISSGDQIVPLFLMDIMGDLHGLPGLFTSAVFAAALSSVSSALNSLSAVILEDFIRPIHKSCWKKEMSAQSSTMTSRVIAVVCGVITLALSFSVEHMGKHMSEIPGTVWGITSAPIFGTFMISMMVPWATGPGCMAGLLTSLAFTLWMGIGGIWYGSGRTVLAPLGQCIIETNATTTTTIVTMTTARGILQDFYDVSYAWYGLIGIVVCVTVGLAASLLHILLSGSSRRQRGEQVAPSMLFNTADRCCCCCPADCKNVVRAGVSYEDAQKLDKEKQGMQASGTANQGFEDHHQSTTNM